MNYKDKIILGLSITIIGLLLFMKPIGCGNPKTKTSIDTVTSKSIYSDTLRITKDTIIYKDRPYAVYPKPINTNSISICDDSIRVYKNSFNDKYVSISTSDSISGKSLSKSLKYTLKIPKDCVVVTNDITIHDSIVKSPKFSIYGGIEIGSSKTTFNNASPYISVNVKNKQFTYKYNLLESTHNIGVGMLLYKTKK